MEASSAMEPPSAVEAAASYRPTAEPSAKTALAMNPTAEAAFIMEGPTAVESAEFSGTAKTRATNPAAPIETGPATPVGLTVETVKPGPCADEDAASKVVWPVVAIRGAGVRIIAVVSIRTVRRRTCVNRPRRRDDRANTHRDRHLSVSRSDSRRKHQQPQHKSVL